MTQPNELESRLSRLERDNKLLRIVMLTIITTTAIACTMLDATPTVVSTTTLQTKTLQILNENGDIIAELGSNGLLFLDDQGRTRLSLHHNDEETGMHVHDKAGDSRIGVVHFAHGGSGVALHGPEVRGAAVLYYKQTGSLSFYDADGNLSHRIAEQ